MNKSYSGHIALVGRPNAGKSTLLNKILDTKHSIVTHKAQTTRHNLIGAKIIGQHQLLFVDTPGMHSKQKRELNRWMNRAASDAIKNADLVIFLVTISEWTRDDQWVLDVIQKAEVPVLLCVNKLDQVGSEAKLNRGIESLTARHEFAAVTTISAKNNIGVERVLSWCQQNLPEGEHIDLPELTDRPEEFFVEEIIREQILLRFHEELPYASYVEVELLEEQNGVTHIHAVIYVENDGQKKIIIGKSGLAIKEIGQRARIRLEKKFAGKVFLKLWVRVKPGWSNNLTEDLSQDFF